MTEQLVLDLLVRLHVVRVSRDAETQKFLLHIVDGGHAETVPVVDYKREHVDAIAELEDQKADVLQNRFADPQQGQIGLGGGSSILAVQFTKRDDQLSEAEQQEKKRRLVDLNREIARHREIVNAMNFIQVNFNDVAARLSPGHAFMGAAAELPAGKTLWTKGFKLAAVQCLREFEEATQVGRSELDVCRAFLDQYVFPDAASYTAEQLLNAALQIRRLDRAD
jgi:hypothetical protein